MVQSRQIRRCSFRVGEPVFYSEVLTYLPHCTLISLLFITSFVFSQDLLISSASTLKTLDWWMNSVSRMRAEMFLAVSKLVQGSLELGTTTLVVSMEPVMRC